MTVTALPAAQSRSESVKKLRDRLKRQSEPDPDFSKEYVGEDAGRSDQIHEYLRRRSQRIWKYFGPIWLNNVRLNIPQINETYVGHQLNDGLARAAKRVNSEQVFVFAPGASLKQYEPFMEEIAAELPKHGLIVASPTVLPWMRRFGLEPDILVAADPNPNQADPIIKTGGPKDMLLICPPIISRELVTQFKRKNVYWYNSVIMDETGGIEDNDYSTIMLMLLKPLRQFVVQAGSVTNQVVLALRSAIDSSTLNASRIVLVGADYGYWKGLARVPFYEQNDDGTWVEGTYREAVIEPDHIEWDGMSTNRRMVLYKRSLLYFWWVSMTPIYSCSEGILHELPYVSMWDILKDQYRQYLSKDEITQIVRQFMEVDFPASFPALLEKEGEDGEGNGQTLKGGGSDPGSFRIGTFTPKELL